MKRNYNMDFFRVETQIMHFLYMGLVARKHVFEVSDKASFKPVSSATETTEKLEISLVARLHIALFKTRITKALIRLRGCAGWSAPVLFANPEDSFSRVEAQIYYYVVAETLDLNDVILHVCIHCPVILLRNCQ